MVARPLPQLDLATLLAARAFTADDLAHNRGGTLSPAQEAWRAANPKFMDDDGDHSIEAIVGRVAVEGKYLAGRMGETRFAELVRSGRRLSLRPGLERALVRDAPYRAYAAHGWIWSIEPISEEDLQAATGGIVTYRSAPQEATGAVAIARALQENLYAELGFDEGDVAANRAGHFSLAQRAVGRKNLFFGGLRSVISAAIVVGLFALLAAGAPEFAQVVSRILGLKAEGPALGVAG